MITFKDTLLSPQQFLYSSSNFYCDVYSFCFYKHFKKPVTNIVLTLENKNLNLSPLQGVVFQQI